MVTPRCFSVEAGQAEAALRAAVLLSFLSVKRKKNKTIWLGRRCVTETEGPGLSADAFLLSPNVEGNLATQNPWGCVCR
jgi:hypothetical protein